MKAKLIRDLKKIYPNGVVVEMVLWLLPKPTADRPHRLKYRFYCGNEGRCIVRYDNETGKGDHIHYGEEEYPYKFVSPEQLVTDFLGDVKKLAEVNDEEA
ncbi:toxin-antitoxin system TumE family protein [Sulfuricella sp.]|uniref:toxin-antitoxin system TumE family protein n=1 Tax=Sulfuricella sp. TaxID=2099377 RepID=UPI002BCBD82E|nr:DUF6516 family protein [Sulfuricella sp.]HUX63221.1 DUF6516 family protein [Sulfuricella sp.]